MNKGHFKSKRRKKKAKKSNGERKSSFQLPLFREDVKAMLMDNLRTFAVDVALRFVDELLEDELRETCGERYSRSADRRASRHGSQRGSVVIAGQKVPIDKPRARHREGSEFISEIYSILNRADSMPESVLRRLILGVSCRDYDRAIEMAADGFGVQRSSVSRAFKEASAQRLREFAERRFDSERFLCVFIDGIDFGGETVVVALGVKPNGIKQLLGVRQGATETATVCKEMLESLTERGLKVEHPTLFVLDGSKALRKAVLSIFGKYAFIQRCQNHKKRNVQSHLSDAVWADISTRLNRAYNETDYERALKMLNSTAEWLDRINPSAANSLREGMEETLTVVKLGVHDELRKTVSTTNPIESALSITRRRTRRVTNWQPGDMRLRWCAVGLLEAESRFRRVRGYKHLRQLESALQREYNKKGFTPDKWIA